MTTETKTIQQRYEELETLLREHREAITETALANNPQSQVLDAYTKLKSKAFVAGKEAEEAVPFPVYSQHPDWPEEYEKARVRIEEIKNYQHYADRFRNVVRGLANPGDRSLQGELRLGGPASSALDAIRNAESVGEPGELSKLEKSASGYNRAGGRVQRIRKEMYEAYNTARNEAQENAFTMVMDAGRNIVRSHGRALASMRVTKIDISARYSKLITEALDSYTASANGTV